MGVEHSGESINWGQVQELAANGVPVGEWFDEEMGELTVTTNTGFGGYHDRSNHSFNLLYDALRGELPQDQREVTDRFYAMFHWWDQSTADCTPLPAGLRTQVIDLNVNNDIAIINGIFSPDSVKEACGYASSIDFGQIRNLIDQIYPDPQNWQNADQIPNTTKSPLIVDDWKHQSKLVEFDQYNRFFSAADAFDHATTWVEPICKTGAKEEGFLLTVSY